MSSECANSLLEFSRAFSHSGLDPGSPDDESKSEKAKGF